MPGPEATFDEVESGVAAGLPPSAQQEQFSLAFVQLVVAAPGCSIKTHATDYDGVDITIASSAEYDVHYCPQFELQVKCTTQDQYLQDDHLAWPMRAGPYRRLTNPKRFIPAYLGVLLVPRDVRGWLEQDDQQLLTRSRLYVERASQLGELPASQSSKTVRLPRCNLFTVTALESIMATIGDGGEW